MFLKVYLASLQFKVAKAIAYLPDVPVPVCTPLPVLPVRLYRYIPVHIPYIPVRYGYRYDIVRYCRGSPS